MSNSSNKNLKHGGMLASFTSVILLGFILVLVNYIAGFAVFKADLTSEKLFTLSEGTRSALSKLGDKVRLKFYFSRSMGNVPFPYKLYGKRVEEFLGEYVANSRGMLELEVLDPQPDTDVEEWAVKYGLAAPGLPTGERFYFGLVALAADKEEVIQFFALDREEFLEYDITRAIVQAAAGRKANIGIISALPVVRTDNMPFAMPQQGNDDWLFVRELRKNFNVRQIPAAADVIDADIDLLLVIHPRGFSENTYYAIDQFVLKGGRAIVMTDPTCLADKDANPQNPYMAMMSSGSDAPALFKAWGVQYSGGNLVADNALATQLNMGQQGLVNHPLWLSLKGDSFNRESMISAKLNSMLLVNTGSLSKAADSKYEFTSLLQTTAGGAEVEKFKVMSSPDDVRRELPATGSRKTLAALIRGEFDSAFAQPPAEKAPENETEDAKKAREARFDEKKKQHVAKAVKSVSVMVIADADFLQNDYSVRAINFFGSTLLQPINDNLAFISNCVDLLAGSSDLIAVRSRNRSTRTFTRVEEIEREAQKKWQEEEITLTRKLEEIQNRINQLQSQKKDGERLILSAEQRDEVNRARKEQSETMRRRREIRKLLRQDIESLGIRVTFVNLLLMPLLIMIVGTYIYFRQNTRRSML
ncbi:MAG: Gldg family protein [Candidatus Rifleibacteriota bacterium]